MRRLREDQIAVNHVEVTPKTLKIIYALSHRSGQPIHEIIAMAVAVFAYSTRNTYTFNQPPSTEYPLTKKQRAQAFKDARKRNARPTPISEILEAMAKTEKEPTL